MRNSRSNIVVAMLSAAIVHASPASPLIEEGELARRLTPAGEFLDKIAKAARDGGQRREGDGLADSGARLSPERVGDGDQPGKPPEEERMDAGGSLLDGLKKMIEERRNARTEVAHAPSPRTQSERPESCTASSDARPRAPAGGAGQPMRAEAERGPATPSVASVNGQFGFVVAQNVMARVGDIMLITRGERFIARVRVIKMAPGGFAVADILLKAREPLPGDLLIRTR